MRTPLGIFIVVAIILLLDFYSFQALRTVSISASPRNRTIIFSIYWALTAILISIFLIFIFTKPEFFKSVRAYLFAMVLGMIIAKITIVFFLLIDDIRRIFQWLAIKIFSRADKNEALAENGITRSAFLSWLGLALGTSVFGTLIYGFSNKYNYHIKRVKLAFDNLPAGFKGIKIIQISDIHSGSFADPEAVTRGVQKILDEKPDLILFTGDLVNDKATEMHEYISIFSLLKAPMGVFSTLGNHDYGDYVQWPDEASKKQNLEDLKAIHGMMGWRLLMNEHVPLERGGDKIALLGVENWGAKARFPKLGRLDVAHKGTEDYKFKILMSHDPSHWDAQVLPKYNDIDLTLSGHTHGMQFGIEIPGFKWSPVQYMYKQWAGLYENETNKQKLYVNRGYGFLGYPGRVGIMPEITVIELA